MRSYTFRYMHGQSAPFATLNATDDDHFFKTILPLWEKETGFRHLGGTVVCAMTEYRRVPEPVAAPAIVPPDPLREEIFRRANS